MSRITWQTEQRTVDDPWTQQQETYTVRVGWACECGATQPGRLRRRQTLEQTAAGHLISHGAPTGTLRGCVCGYVTPRTVTTTASDIYGHDRHHEQWLLGVWDA